MILPASLPETIGTYTGFATQEVVRSFLLPYALLVMVLQSFFILRQSAEGGNLRRPLVRLSIYLFVSLLLVSMFLPVLPASLRTTPPGDIESAIAAADGSPIRHAGQIQDARGLSAQALGIPPVMYALVEAISNKWLAIATHIHAAALRPHSGLMPLVWLLRYRLSDDVLYDIGYWVRACVNPAKARLSSSGESLSYQDYLPFEGSRLAEEMSVVRRPRHAGVLNLVRPTVTCDVFTRELVQRTLAVIRTDRTPAGRPVAAVWQAELGITSLDAAQWLIMREVQLTLGEHIDGPDLLHKYGLLKGVGTLARALGSLATGFGLWAGLGSAAASGVGDILERVSGPVGAALFFAEYVPVVVGWSQTFLIGFLFPLAVMWGIASPGRQLGPVIIATSILAAAYSLPVVFALTELWTQALRDSSLSLMQNPLLWADTQVKILVIACLGPVGMGLIAVALTTSGYVVSRIVHL